MPESNQPTIFVLFGVSGDLAKRKVLPALYHLVKDGLLPEKCRIIGTTRQDLSKANLLKTIELCVLETEKVCDPEVLRKFNTIFEVLKFDPTLDTDYQKLKKHLNDIEESEGVCFNRLFYLSIPPQVYAPIVKQLGKSGLAKSCEHGVAKSRLIVEKPFGYDLKSAKYLIKQTAKSFHESQVFRIDHFLAKETAQNILAFRRHNPLFYTIWDKSMITRINVRALESIGIEGRSNFYESIGALRDIIQSHLLQLLAITTMDLPEDISSSKQIHDSKIKLLNKTSLQKINNASLVRGQYETYRQEVNNPSTTTETYVKLSLNIKTKRWAGVPIVLETGKSLASKTTDVTNDFVGNDSGNQLTIRIQPDEGIDIKLFVKKPGFDNSMQPAVMDFSYKVAFEEQAHPDAYERVIVDAIRGDQSLFASSKEVIRSWEIIQPILKRWQDTSNDLVIYPNESSGPSSRDLVN